MRKLIIGLITYFVLSCTGLAPAFATTIPFRGPNDFRGSNNLQLGSCPSGISVLGGTVRDEKGTEYFYFLSGTGNFILGDNSSDMETPVWMGTIDKDGRFVVTRELRFSELIKLYPRPCDSIAPEVS